MASTEEIAEEIESLAIHFRPPIMDNAARSRWLEDWCSDLSEYPIQAIKTAVRRWREGTNPKFPLLGQFLPLVKAVNFSGKGPSGGDVAWRRATPEEYHAMSIREKIRHHQIMAMTLRRQAGPMWAGKRHIAADRMPRAWHDLQTAAKQQESHAAKLREQLSQYTASTGMDDRKKAYDPITEIIEGRDRSHRPEVFAVEDEKVFVELPSIAGKPDETGITAAMRDAMNRQAEGA